MAVYQGYTYTYLSRGQVVRGCICSAATDGMEWRGRRLGMMSITPQCFHLSCCFTVDNETLSNMACTMQFWEIEFLCKFHCWPHRATRKIFARFRGPRQPGMSDSQVQLVQCIASLPRGSGHCNSRYALPHCLGEVGVELLHCTASQLRAGGHCNSCNALPHCLWAAGGEYVGVAPRELVHMTLGDRTMHH